MPFFQISFPTECWKCKMIAGGLWLQWGHTQYQPRDTASYTQALGRCVWLTQNSEIPVEHKLPALPSQEGNRRQGEWKGAGTYKHWACSSRLAAWDHPPGRHMARERGSKSSWQMCSRRKKYIHISNVFAPKYIYLLIQFLRNVFEIHTCTSLDSNFFQSFFSWKYLIWSLNKCNHCTN